MNQHPAYEVHGHRENGEVFGVAVLGRLSDAEALALAQQYADRWQATVSLCRVPFVDQGQISGWWADEIETVTQVVPTIEGSRP